MPNERANEPTTPIWRKRKRGVRPSICPSAPLLSSIDTDTDGGSRRRRRRGTKSRGRARAAVTMAEEEDAVVSSLSFLPSFFLSFFLSLHFLSSRLTRRRCVRGGDDVSRTDGGRATHSLSDVFTKRVAASAAAVAPSLVLMLCSLEGCPLPPSPFQPSILHPFLRSRALCVPALGILIGFF